MKSCRATATLLFFFHSLFAQRPVAKLDKSYLTESFKKINYWVQKIAEYNSKENYDKAMVFGDSLETANQIFEKNLKIYISKYPVEIAQSSTELKNAGLIITESTDGLFKIYTWDTHMGGTWHDFHNIYQYKIEKKLYAFAFNRSSNDDTFSDACSKIFTLNFGNKRYYLVASYGIYSSKDRGQNITAFAIEKGALDPNVKIFKTKNGLIDRISFTYDFFSIGNPEPEFVFVKTANLIRIPIIIRDNKFFHKYITYKFTGQYFERVK